MNAIEIKKLVKKYWKDTVLKEINLDIKKWDFFALLWHNWAWKTTIISILTNLVSKNSWKVKINWINIDSDFSEARKFIWVVPQEFNFDVFAKVKTIPLQQAGYYWISKKIAEERVEYFLKKLGLWDKRDSKAKDLSWWMKRRLMIVRALIHKPKILILDEPTAWVDVELRASMWKFIKKLNEDWTTILLTTHYLEEVEALCKNVAIINKWKIIENTTVKKLLSKLNEETIVLTLKNKLSSIDSSLKKNYKALLLNENEIEITISKKGSLNNLFLCLNKLSIEVSSLRNKANRLEQLFINMTK